MSPEEKPNVRLPMLWSSAVERWFGGVCFLAITILLGWAVFAAPGLQAPSLVILALTVAFGIRTGVMIWENFSYRGSFLVFDATGVARLHKGTRQGLSWGEIYGFDWKTCLARTSLFLKRKDGSGIEIRLPIASGVNVEVATSLLERHMAHELSVPHVPTTELGLRLARYHHMPPPIEMEPHIPYRYADVGNIADFIRGMRWVFCGFGFFIAIQFVTSFPKSIPYSHLIRVIGPAVVLLFLAWKFLDDARLIRSLKDRFILRDGTLFVIHDGKEEPLPEGRPSRRKVLNQPLTQHGTGLFAYRMAPQFLEPDLPKPESPGA